MEQRFAIGFPRPKKALIGAMVLVGALWLFFALGMNWGGASTDVFGLMVGSNAVFEGQVWRLFTSFLVHRPSGNGAAGHLLTTLMGLYFLGQSLEDRWGGKRFVGFLVACGVFASLTQLLVGAVVASVHQPVFYGGLGVVDAVAIAWAMTFLDRQVNLFFVLPVSGKGLIVFVVGLNLLYLIALESRPEGLAGPFGGMLAGWLLADGSPLRRFYLQWRFKRLQTASQSLRSLGVQRGPGLRVIEGGGGKKPDKRTLN